MERTGRNLQKKIAETGIERSTSSEVSQPVSKTTENRQKKAPEVRRRASGMGEKDTELSTGTSDSFVESSHQREKSGRREKEFLNVDRSKPGDLTDSHSASRSEDASVSKSFSDDASLTETRSDVENWKKAPKSNKGGWRKNIESLNRSIDDLLVNLVALREFLEEGSGTKVGIEMLHTTLEKVKTLERGTEHAKLLQHAEKLYEQLIKGARFIANHHQRGEEFKKHLDGHGELLSKLKKEKAKHYRSPPAPRSTEPSLVNHAPAAPNRDRKKPVSERDRPKSEEDETSDSIVDENFFVESNSSSDVLIEKMGKKTERESSDALDQQLNAGEPGESDVSPSSDSTDDLVPPFTHDPIATRATTVAKDT